MNKERVKCIKEMMELDENDPSSFDKLVDIMERFSLNPQQRNWLYLILKSLYDTRFDGSFDDNDMQTIHSIMHDLNLYYDSSDDGAKTTAHTGKSKGRFE